MWQEVGKQRVIPATLESKKVYCFGGVDIDTLKVIHIMRERKRSLEFTEFLAHIERCYVGRKKIIVLDNYSIHKSRYVQEWSKGREIEFLFLPTYAPELNPMEDIWRVVKNKVCRNHYHQTIGNLIQAVKREFYRKSYEKVILAKLAA